ncbi:SGNH/GDSL hydrolase family protein [Colwellia asteriadis]|uniref:SGNH/GDSL hydrolase family protein n=1 Tax=Colwellia asteriadis TaxID=517723 RepID=A0ABN1LBH0_9GAMM
MTINILCFGDSNTWGTSPSGERYNKTQRWSGRLAQLLSEVATVIEAGQPNRTLVHNFPFAGDKSGISYLRPYLQEYKPELVLIMLGTNDLKNRFALTVEDVALAMQSLTEQVLNFSVGKGAEQNTTGKVMIIAPPPLYEVGSYINIYQNGAKKSQQLAPRYAQVAKKLGCYFFDAGSVVQTCADEGVHWQVNQHQLLAQALSREIINIFAPQSPLVAKSLNHS